MHAMWWYGSLEAIDSVDARPSALHLPAGVSRNCHALPRKLQQDLILEEWAWVDSNHRPHAYQAPDWRQSALVSADLQGFPGLSADQRQPALVGAVTACVTATPWAGLLVLLQQRLEARVVAGDYSALCNYGSKMSPPAPGTLGVGVS